MPSVGDPCYRDRDGVAYMELPFRVRLSNGDTRTEPEQWFADEAVRQDTGWTTGTLTQADIDRLFPPAPAPSWLDTGYQTSYGWRLAWTPDDVALLTGLYVLSQRATALGVDQPIVVTDMAGERHTLTAAEFEAVMLGYGAARAAASAED